MQIPSGLPHDLYYTVDHEWINFQGMLAFTGVAAIKLAGFDEVQFVVLQQLQGFRRQGEVLAALKCRGREVKVHMPVDGNIIAVNEEVLYTNSLLNATDGSCWIAQLFPSKPYQRTGLISSFEYNRIIHPGKQPVYSIQQSPDGTNKKEYSN